MRPKFLLAIVLGALSLSAVLPLGCSDNPTESARRLMSLSTTSLEFSSWAGQHPDPAQLKVAVMRDGTATTDWSASTDADWLQLGPGGTDTLYVNVISDTLLAGVYIDSIMVATPGASNSPLRVQISLTVRNLISVSRDSLLFVGLSGGDNPEPGTFIVSDYEGRNVTYEATSDAGWLSLANATGTVPGIVTVSPEISGLPGGYYEGDIVITSAELPSAEATVHCQLTLSSWALTDISFLGHASTIRFECTQFADSSVGWISGWFPVGVEGRRGTVFRTTDGGETWSSVLRRDNAAFGGLAVQDADRCWVVGDSAWADYTQNAGGNWIRSDNLPIDRTVDLAQICFVGYLDGWIVGDKGTILHTENNGLDWSLQTTPTNHDLSDLYLRDSQTGWTVGNHGTILHTTNAGNTWTAQDAGTVTDLRSIWFVNNLVGWAVGAQGVTLRTDNGGTSWIPVDIGTSGFLQSIYFASPTHGWVVGLNGEIRHTSDGGLSWLLQPTGLNANLSGVYFYNNSLGWVVGDFGTILKTTAGGF